MVSISFVSLCLDGFYLLRLAKDVIAENGTDNDEDNGETCLQQTFDYRPACNTHNAGIGKLLRDDAHGRNGK